MARPIRALLGGAAVLFIMLLGTGGVSPHDLWAVIALVSLSVLLALYLSIAVHEMGHAIAAVLVGFQLRSVRIGPLWIQRRYQVRFRFNRKQLFDGHTAVTAVAPHALAWRGMWLSLAGPVANLLVAGTAVLLHLVSNFFVTVVAIMNLVVGLENLVPMRGPDSPTDGLRLWMCLRAPKTAERWLALGKLTADCRDGVPLESLSEEFMEKALAARDHSPEAFRAHLLAYATACERRRDEKAAQLLETCLSMSDTIALAGRVTVQSAAASFQADRRGRPDLAEAWLADIPDREENASQRAMAKSAILKSRAEYASALKEVEIAERTYSNLTDLARRRIFLEELAKWKNEIIEAANKSTGKSVMPAAST